MLMPEDVYAPLCIMIGMVCTLDKWIKSKSGAALLFFGKRDECRVELILESAAVTHVEIQGIHSVASRPLARLHVSQRRM